ncbi:hypothetical protein MD484_g1309, partial [Candolleomyces efflorescens]
MTLAVVTNICLLSFVDVPGLIVVSQVVSSPTPLRPYSGDLLMPRSRYENIWRRMLKEEEESLAGFDGARNDLLRPDLPHCGELYESQYTSPPPGTTLSAKDWAMRWIPHLALDAGPRWLRYGNTFQMLCEVSQVPQDEDCWEMSTGMVACIWAPSPDRAGMYVRRDPKTGAIDLTTHHPAAVVWEDARKRCRSYLKAAKGYICKGGMEKMRDIMMCFDESLTQSEKISRAILLRESMGLPTRVPVCIDSNGLIEAVAYDFASGFSPPHFDFLALPFVLTIMAEDQDPRIVQLETYMFPFVSLGAIDVDSYLELATSHRENIGIDLAAAKTNGDSDLGVALLEKDKILLSNIFRLRREKDSRIHQLEKSMKVLPKTLDEVNAYLELATNHQSALASDLNAAQHMQYADLCIIAEKAEKALQTNIGKLRRLKGRLDKSALKKSGQCTDPPQPPSEINPPPSVSSESVKPPTSEDLAQGNKRAFPPQGEAGGSKRRRTDDPQPPSTLNPRPPIQDEEPPAPVSSELVKPPSLDHDVDLAAKEQPRETVNKPNGKAPKPSLLKSLIPLGTDADNQSDAPLDTEDGEMVKEKDRDNDNDNDVDNDVDTDEDGEDEDKETGKRKRKGKGKAKKAEVEDDGNRRAKEWHNLPLIVRNNILKDAEDELEQHIAYNLPLSHQCRSWARRAHCVAPQAAFRSKRLAASLFILTNGRTVCHFHILNDKAGAINDMTTTSDDEFQITGVPFKRLGEDAVIRTPAYLTRAYGHDRPPKPTARNRNFTLERVLEFFPVVDGIHTMHCGCTLDEALIDLYFWKRINLRSASRGITEPYTKPMRPRERLFLASVLRFLDFDLDLMYSYDEDGYRQSTAAKFEKYAERLLEAANEMRGESRTKKPKDDGKRKKKLEYVEVPDKPAKKSKKHKAGPVRRERHFRECDESDESDIHSPDVFFDDEEST